MKKFSFDYMKKQEDDRPIPQHYDNLYNNPDDNEALTFGVKMSFKDNKVKKQNNEK